MIAISFEQRLILIGGTAYAGENKKSVFTVLNYLLPERGRDADALLGQPRRRRPATTSRSSSASRAPARPRSRPTPARVLIGDDEHGWSDDGTFNFEGGCYAKTINLSPRGRAGDLRHHHAASAPSSRTWSTTR